MKVKLLLMSLISIIVLMACSEKKEEKKEEVYKYDGGILDFLNEIVKDDATIINKPQ